MLKYWLGFNRVPGIGAKRLRTLLEHFGDIETAWLASTPALVEVGLDRRTLQNLVTLRAELDLDQEIAQLKGSGINVLTWEDDAYPDSLRRIDAPPPVLFYRGDLVPEDAWAIAIVGTRRATVYGREVALRLTQDLSRAGLTIVSGLARGIDAVAHQTSLESGGRTLAVLGNGLDTVYPSEHRNLARLISNQGAIISEYPLGTRPEARNFPARNRIVSGLSLGVVVVEGRWSSGAVITAKQALEQGREVFAVPGSILSSFSEGPNRLIKDGATPVTRAADILEALNLTQISLQIDARQALPDDPTELQLLDLLSAEPRHVDEIRRAADKPVSEVTSVLALMELKGLVRQVGGMQYVAIRETSVTYSID